MPNQTILNPQAPPVYSGISGGTPPGYMDVGFDYVYNVVLTANQQLSDSVSITNDADFIAKAVVLNVATAVFSVRFSDSNGYYLSNAQVLSTNLQSDSAAPYAIEPELPIPAGGKIGIDLTELSGAQNTIQIVPRS